MKDIYKYIIFFTVCLIIGLAVWYFQSIVTYILISFVLSLIGGPIVSGLGRIKLKKFYLPKGLRAGITLLFLWIIFGSFFRFFIPLIAIETQKLSQINPDLLIQAIQEPLSKIDTLINQLNTHNAKISLFDLLTARINSIVNISFFTNMFSSLASTIGNLIIALFSISFITFFFLKDENLFSDGILILVPTKHEEAAKRVMISTKDLLMRYFVGIAAQISGIIILVTLGLTICGLSFNTCIVIALFAGIINVIPYIGPLIGSIFGIIIGVASKIELLPTSALLPLVIYIALVFVIVHLIDNIFFQPYIFSNSVKAHPLEIFLVILITGHLAGIIGMLIAIPGYTVVRVFAKQFFNNFKVVQKLTEKI